MSCRICLVLIILMAAAPVRAFRDPFHLPVVRSKPKASVPKKTETVQKAPELTLSAIMQHSGENAALINGQIVREKDTLGGVTIAKITMSQVIVDYKGKQYKLELR